MNKKTTKKEVAQLAGVSHMTVSRVLNHFPYVSKQAREKVLSACRELNYRPNIIASSLRSKKTYALGVVVPTFKHTFYARFLNRVEEECKKAGYHIIVIQGRKAEDLKIQLEWSDLEFLLARQIDGLLIDLELPREILAKLRRESIPIVFVDMPPEDNGFSFVGTTDFEGTRELTHYLIRSGHRRIAFFSGPEGRYTSDQRLEGYKSALKENNIPVSGELISYTNYQTSGGYESMLKLLSVKRNFTALIGANDYIAIGALCACSQKGIKVPEDVSVAGFTGDEIGAYTVPPLTTMVQPIEEIGKKAVEILLAKIRDPNRPVERVLLPPGLLKRNSVKSWVEENLTGMGFLW